MDSITADRNYGAGTYNRAKAQQQINTNKSSKKKG
jgi:hypothetical protein